MSKTNFAERVWNNDILLANVISLLSADTLYSISFTDKRAWILAIPHLWKVLRPTNIKTFRHLSVVASNRLPISIRNYSCYGELVKEIRLSLLAGRWEKVTFELMSPLLKSCINLTVLDMNLCSNIRSTEFIVLFVYNSQMCQSLKYLDIRETGLSPEAMAAGIMMMPNLELLDVSDTEADNKLLIALAQSNPQLKHLSLDRCIDVTDQGIELLVEKCKNLEVISIKNCPYIGNYAVMDDHNIQVEHEDNSDESWSDESWSDN